MFQSPKTIRTCGGLLLVALSILVVLSGAHTQEQADSHEFLFPCQAQTFFVQDAGKAVASVRSPDGQKQVLLEDPTTFRVIAQKHTLEIIRYYEINSNIFLGWSPDSSQFFIMYSDGDWHVHVFAVNGDRVRELSSPKTAFEDFGKKHSCKTRENSILFLSWTSDSQRIFLVTEVHPTSDCGAEAGRFQGYLMQVETGEIMRRFNERETTEIERDCRAAGILKLPN
jgi:hypothetical protein